MEYLSVLVAGIAAYAFGAVWYMALSKPWMEAAGVEAGEDGRPKNDAGAKTYIMALIGAIVVAGMMRHVFVLAGIDTADKGLVSGFGLGLFIVLPWIATNYGFAGRPGKLVLIDGAYAVIGCTIIGLILTLF